LQLIAIPKIEKVGKSVFDPILIEVAIHQIKVAIVAICNTYTNVYKLLYYIVKVQSSNRHICMSRLPPNMALVWHSKEMYVLHYKYYNNYTFLQANSKVRKTNVIVLFFFKNPKLNSFQHCSKVAILKLELQFPVAIVAIKLQLDCNSYKI